MSTKQTRKGVYELPVYATGGAWVIRYEWEPGEDGTPPWNRIEDATAPTNGLLASWHWYYRTPDGRMVDINAAMDELEVNNGWVYEAIRLREVAR